MNIQAEIKQINRMKKNRELAIESAKKVFALPSGTPERWQAGIKHFLRQRPDALPEYHAIARQVKLRKQEVDKFSSTKHARIVMSKPSWFDLVLKQTDPDYFLGHSPKYFVGAKHLRLMKKAFPEFFLPEVI